MSIFDLEVLQGYIRLCNDGWLQGWHERNGGNLTYRMTEEEAAQCRPFFKKTPGPWVEMGVQADNLKGEYFIATGSGKYLRNVILAPQDNLCICEINQAGDSYRIVWGLEKGGKPTSEFPSHFLNALWQSATECPVVFPGGVGVVPWMVPGGADIALATSKLMKEYDAAVWAHHGLFVSGPDFDTAFGLMHTIEKAAEIYMKVVSSGKPVLQTIRDADLQAIADEFGVKLNQAFLG